MVHAHLHLLMLMKSSMEQQPVMNRQKDFWQKGQEPRIYPIDGEYEPKRGRMKKELREDFVKYMDKVRVKVIKLKVI